MLLKDICSEINKSLKLKINNTKLSTLIGGEDYANYTLFDFLNIYKIRRMKELGYINNIVEKQLIVLYKKYNTKLLEIKNYSENHEFVKTLQEELLRIEDELEFYSIHPNRKNSLITIENMVDFEINQHSYRYLDEVPTFMLNSERIEKLNESFVSKIFNTTSKEIDFAVVYNLLKIAFLSEERFIFSNDAIRVEEDYKKYLITQDKKIYEELSKEPYSLMLDGVKFDIVNYMTWTITRDFQKQNQTPKYINKEIR